MNRVVFLDIDGVMCTPRAALALGDYGLIRQFDPVAVSFLNQLHEAAPFEIVVTSTWRKEASLPILLQAVGIRAMCAHPNWRTDDLWFGGTQSADARPREIRAWLDANGEREFIILDDDCFNWLPDQLPRWVPCDGHDGISLKAMKSALDLFGTTWPAKGRRG